MLVKERVNIAKNQKGEYDLWQRRYWEHEIRDEDDLRRHVDYIHFNPVKHNHVIKTVDWPYSSFHRYVRLGVLPENWGGDVIGGDEKGFGESSRITFHFIQATLLLPPLEK